MTGHEEGGCHDPCDAAASVEVVGHHAPEHLLPVTVCRLHGDVQSGRYIGFDGQFGHRHRPAADVSERIVYARHGRTVITVQPCPHIPDELGTVGALPPLGEVGGIVATDILELPVN